MYRVKKDTNPNKLAGAIAIGLRTEETAALQCIGPAAVNQAVKAIIIARGFLAPEGIDIEIIPSFGNVKIDGETKSLIHFQLNREMDFELVDPEIGGEDGRV